MSCHIFGHYCPVFLVAEPFTETSDLCKGNNSIPFQTRLRVARRDNYTCEECGQLLREHELEFDHIIPRSLGGTSEEHNIRLMRPQCGKNAGGPSKPEGTSLREVAAEHRNGSMIGVVLQPKKEIPTSRNPLEGRLCLLALSPSPFFVSSFYSRLPPRRKAVIFRSLARPARAIPP